MAVGSGAALVLFVICWLLSRRFERFPGTNLWLVCIGCSLAGLGLDIGAGVINGFAWAAARTSDVLAALSTIGSNG